MAARGAIPLADVGRQVGGLVHDDVPLPAFPLTHVVEDRDATWRLHDPPEAPTKRGAKFGKPAGQAAVCSRAVLRTIVTIDAPKVSRVVSGRRFRASRRGHGIVCPTVTPHRLNL